MLYLSTDYVFDGQGTEPWELDCKDYKPLNVYGQTKLDGGLSVIGTLDKYSIVRIAWVLDSKARISSKQLLMSVRHMMKLEWLTIKLVRRHMLSTLLVCSLICVSLRSMAITMQQTKAVTLVGMTSV